MERIVIVSTNNNPDYYFYSPYIKKAWNTLGWKVCVLITSDTDESNVVGDYVFKLPSFEGIRQETVAQAGRLYAANLLPSEWLLMTSDMDLLPLSDYWHPNPEKITNYGHDLTDHTFYTMGYTAMTGAKWIEVMKLTGNTQADMLRDFNDESIPHSPKSDNWENWWNYDWSLLTRRLKPYEGSMDLIMRGRRKDSPFAFGRIDRGDSMKIIGKPWIDAHCENVNVKHPVKLEPFLTLYNSVYGQI